ncbi:P-loop NTPase fold protein [Pontixanthobacter sp. CEM42]|uniref:KAP family P-loop NTPase fold protein n=1 Tax=Pontixanthobacter sp. CEM42 TaxID=2792077 RepID=UPI001ADEC26D|nr:P-loop NTPase fold protein [Pontixanthobacter sp. CEM42]
MPDENQTEVCPEEHLSNIWNDDLFGRRAEATQLSAYIKSVAARPKFREDKSAYTIAIDAQYGEGKSFFLKRLARQLELEHPVAFVDAWADDLADEPLTALAATLKEALQPFVHTNEVRDGLAEFMSKTGKVAKIAGGGLLRRGIGFAIGAGATELAEGVISGLAEETRSDVDDAIGSAVNTIVDDASDAVSSITPHALMEARVSEFEEGKVAVQSMKDSLVAIVDALGTTGKSAPIVIVIDELDRCRPTYALKLLEEIKHLFDVPGLVFVLAMHGEQLTHSVSGAYGSGFDGASYLRRFIDRKYRLRKPDVSKLIDQLCGITGVSDGTFVFPDVMDEVGRTQHTLPKLIAEYMRMYGLTARDGFQLVDMMQTASALVGTNHRLFVPYFLPLAIGQLIGSEDGELPKPADTSKWTYHSFGRFGQARSKHDFVVLADSIHKVAQMPRNERHDYVNNNDGDYVAQIALEDLPSSDSNIPLWTIFGLAELVRTVGRFENPKISPID